MCGIVGYVGFRNASKTLRSCLKNLEYRGYDSAGMAVANPPEKVVVSKNIGSIDNLKIPKGNFVMGIAHTRWATHGGISIKNSHPQWDCKKKIFVVHNGILENYEDIKSELEKKGHKFTSDTDTEIIPHFFEDELKKGSVISAMKKFTKSIRGTYAVAMLIEGHDKIYVMKNSSPLAIGVGRGEMFLGSDIYAFSEFTNRAIFIDDFEYGYISKSGYKLFKNGKEITKKPKKFKWTSHTEKKNYKHFMLKEIHEEPEAVRRLLSSLKNEQKGLMNKLVHDIKKSKKIYFVASGTSYHSTLIATYLLNKLGYDTHTMIASEFGNYMNVDRKTLLIAVSQSGETMDVINVIKKFRGKSKIVSVVNVPYSTIQRLSDYSLEIMAGQEIAVAATKSFVNQVVLFRELANKLGLREKTNPDDIRNFIKSYEPKTKRLAKKLFKKRDIYIIGRGIGYPVAREIALKLKEISYIHAEGMMGGELKHGTIALIEKGTPVIALISDEFIESNAIEVKSRGAYVIPLKFKNFEIDGAIFGHLLSYYIALYKHLPIDKPRNLAKSVTVI